MVYSRNVSESLKFYRDVLGFEVLEEFAAPFGVVYARLRPPSGQSTIALHRIEPGKEFQPGAIRLYFEVPRLTAFCNRLTKRGVVFSKMPAVMPWGWTHAYLNDPDGHEVSLYWAGAKRLRSAR